MGSKLAVVLTNDRNNNKPNALPISLRIRNIARLNLVDKILEGTPDQNASLIKEAWKNSPEYTVGGQITRRVFGSPEKMYYDENTGGIVAERGTTDLAWCSRIMKEGLFKGKWAKYAKKKYPFLVDTNIFVKHITPDGIQYPLEVPAKYLKE